MTEELLRLGDARFRRVSAASRRFFDRHADALPRAACAMAERFRDGGRLLVWGAGPAAGDANHVSVEFLHPVIVGQRALPAIALAGDPAARLRVITRPQDIALAVANGGGDAALPRFLQVARDLRLLTVGIAGAASAPAADHTLVILDDDPTVVQEVLESACHVLHELVHLFLAHQGTSRGFGASGFGDLYPFLSETPPDAAPALAEARGSTLQKAADIEKLREALWRRHAGGLVRTAELLGGAFRAGGSVLAFGNGGSATDARDLADDLLSPPLPGWRPLPAIDLTRDYAMLTAVANDVSFDKVFARQVIAYGAAGDVAVGFSTSGESPNLIEAFAQARRQGLATIGFAGNRGGRMAEPGFLDIAIVVPSPHNTRIQEAQATACHTMLAMLHELLREAPP